MKRILLLLLPLLTGCATLNPDITHWKNDFIVNADGRRVNIIGNPPIRCYNAYNRLLADGLFVKVEGNYVVVDQWGKGYAWIEDGDGNHCILWSTK